MLLQNEFLCVLSPAIQAVRGCLTIYASARIIISRFCTIIYPQTKLIAFSCCYKASQSCTLVSSKSHVNTIFNVSIFRSLRSSSHRLRAILTVTPLPANINPLNALGMVTCQSICFFCALFVLPDGRQSIFSRRYMRTINLVFLILPEINTLIELLDLMWYNYEVRKYLKGKLVKYLLSNQN